MPEATLLEKEKKHTIKHAGSGLCRPKELILICSFYNTMIKYHLKA